MQKVNRATIYGDPFIGFYARTNDNIVVVANIPEKFAMALEPLGARPIRTSIANSSLAGLYIAMNSWGAIVPHFVSDEEIAKLKEGGLNVTKIKSKLCALGNNVVVNDRAAVINQKFERAAAAQIQDALAVEVVKARVAGFTTPGAALLVTNKGFVAHPAASDEELKWIREIFRVDGGIATANCGVPFPTISVIANSNGAVVGEQTTGWEIGRLRECLSLV